MARASRLCTPAAKQHIWELGLGLDMELAPEIALGSGSELELELEVNCAAVELGGHGVIIPEIGLDGVWRGRWQH